MDTCAENSESRSALTAWLQVVRVPNLLTVPGDPLAGLALAQGLAFIDAAQLALLVTISILLYAAGLMLNDWCDRHVDAKERPQRPIPSGSVAHGAVLAAALLCIALALGAAWRYSLEVFVVASVLAGLVVFYNVLARKWRPLGVATMAMCRAVNLLLGAAAVREWRPDQFPMALAAAAVMFLYILAVSIIAAGETERRPGTVPRWFAGLVIVVAAVPIIGAGSMLIAVILWLALACNTFHILRQLARAQDVAEIGPCVGRLVRGLVLLQVYWLAVAGAAPVWIGAILLCWFGAGWLGRHFYSS